jgi:hypothetical protein
MGAALVRLRDHHGSLLADEKKSDAFHIRHQFELVMADVFLPSFKEIGSIRVMSEQGTYLRV